jgi:hypothetical protein
MAAPHHPIINGIRVDLQALRRLGHSCQPALCRGERTCCSSYEVRAGEDEASRIVGMLPYAARYAPHLRDDEDYANPFEDEDEDGVTLAVLESGACIFAFRGRDGGVRCSLHAAALDLDLPPFAYKPFSCALWPLALSEDEPRTLTVQPGALGFACNASRRPGKGMHRGVVEILTECFGAPFAEAVEQALQGVSEKP